MNGNNKEDRGQKNNVELLKEEIGEILLKGQLEREQIKMKQNLLLDVIESEKQIKKTNIDSSHKEKMEGIIHKDKLLEEAILTGDKDKIAQLLNSMNHM